MGIIYSGPSGDQYEKWAAEQRAIEEAKTIEAEKVEEVVAEEAPKKPGRPAAKK